MIQVKHTQCISNIVRLLTGGEIKKEEQRGRGEEENNDYSNDNKNKKKRIRKRWRRMDGWIDEYSSTAFFYDS